MRIRSMVGLAAAAASSAIVVGFPVAVAQAGDGMSFERQHVEVQADESDGPMGRMHGQMMRSDPDMARMHGQMMRSDPDMARMHGQMMPSERDVTDGQGGS